MKKGFTMIELIFVIVILGILAAVAIPKLGGVKDDAEATKAIQNLGTLKSEITKYYATNSEMPGGTNALTAADLTNLTNVQGLSLGTGNAKGTAVINFKVGNDADCFVIKLDNATSTMKVIPSTGKGTVCKTAIMAAAQNNLIQATKDDKGKVTAVETAEAKITGEKIGGGGIYDIGNVIK